MLKIDLYWDLRSTIPERHTGVGKHVIEAIRGLKAAEGVDLRLLLACDQVSLWDRQKEAYGWTSVPTATLPFGNKRGRVLGGLGLSGGLDRLADGRDLIYSPMEMLLAPKRVPFVNTIHGIPCFESSLPQKCYGSLVYRWERIKQRWFFRRCRRQCHRSFVVSDYLRQQLVDRFSWRNECLHVVYNGADAAFYETDPSTDGNSSRAQRIRLLQVGGANAFDGAPALLKVARYLKVHRPDAKIWIAGDRHESPWEQRLRALPNVVWLGFLSSGQLLEEMRRATALLYVPAVESFGIIGVEAMATGLPVLACRSTALPEVLDDAVCWFDPSDPDSIEAGLENTCRRGSARNRLAERGRQRAATFTWPRTVERILEGLTAAR